MTATTEQIEVVTEYVVQRRVCACGHTILHPTNEQCATCLALFGLAGYIFNGWHYVPRYPIPVEELSLRPQWQRPPERKPRYKRKAIYTRVTIVCARCGLIAWRVRKSRRVCGDCVLELSTQQLRWCANGNHEMSMHEYYRNGKCRACQHTYADQRKTTKQR